MKDELKYTLMVAGMVLSWSVYYAVSKVLVDRTGSALLAGFLLRSAALVFCCWTAASGGCSTRARRCFSCC